MKILIVRPWPSVLDVTKNTYNIQEVGLAKALVKRGHPTDILFWTDGDEMTVKVEVEGAKPIHVFYRHGKVLLKNVWFKGQEKLFAQYDVLQTAEYNQLFSWHLAGKYPEKTVVYHGPYYSPFNKNYNRMCRVFDALFVGRYRRRGTRFLTKSELARKFLLEKRLSPEQVTTVGVGIDGELLRDRPDAGQTELEQKMRAQKTGLKLLYIGRIEPRRDPFFLLDVLAEVRKSDPDACLYIIGGGDAEYVDSVKAAIGEKGLERCVFWQKKAPQYQMKGVYQQADLSCCRRSTKFSAWCCWRRCLPPGGADHPQRRCGICCCAAGRTALCWKNRTRPAGRKPCWTLPPTRKRRPGWSRRPMRRSSMRTHGTPSPTAPCSL